MRTVACVLCVLFAVVRGQLIGKHAHLHMFCRLCCSFVFNHTAVIIGDDTYVYDGEVSLRCLAVQGSATYSFNWLVPDGSTSLSRGQVITSDAVSVLTFTALEEDSGEYTCQVESGSETASDSITVNIGNVNR